MVEVGAGGTEQARYEREVIHDNVAYRLEQLYLGDASLVFGRIDVRSTEDDQDPSYYIGRVAVADEKHEPVVVDWRAPIAEAFYRATGREPMGLSLRRHFATRGRTLLGLEDEVFAEGGLDGQKAHADVGQIRGQGALFAALEESRTGRLGDIVGTIQAEQDDVIRSEMPGVLVVQGGPGTGKTVVALHRAAYLLYTHRFPLEGQGVLVVGPNRLFLGYIEQVLPSLGEAGIELAVLADLIERVAISGPDQQAAARIKGDLRMVEVLSRAIAERQRPLREDLRVGYGAQTLTFDLESSERIVAEARRRYRTHNAARAFVTRSFWEALAASARRPVKIPALREALRRHTLVREALEWMWPVLTPAQFLNDLYGARAVLHHATRGLLRASERAALFRPRSESSVDVVWTVDDVPLLDEARALLGPRPRHGQKDEVRTYGHIVVDEAQDLSPMALRTLRRRSLNGSMTIVGDIAQSTGAWAHDDWDGIVEHLPTRRPHRMVELTVGYRIPAPLMRVADQVLALAAPGLKPARAVRDVGDEPRSVMAGEEGLIAAIVNMVIEERDAVGAGNVAVICPHSVSGDLDEALTRAGIEHGTATRRGLDTQVTVVPVRMVKGLEVDASVVVEPAAIVEQEPQGLRSLFVALTRSTRRLALVHERPLPPFLELADPSAS